MKNEVLTVAQRYEADRLAVKGGTPGITLMENAGHECFEILQARYPDAKRIRVLCGPGHNGGDGFALSWWMSSRGYDVRVGSMCSRADLVGDARIMAHRWMGEIEIFSEELIGDADIIVDAVFGIGLSRPVSGDAARVFDALNSRRTSDCIVVSLDIPSGIDADSGEVCGVAVQADLTVAFCRKTPGHLLLPGKWHCGEVVVADIGISDMIVSDLNPVIRENTPAAWMEDLPSPSVFDHKYRRGHAVVVSGGPTTTGAARLAARGALRCGAGAVTLASPDSALFVHAAHLTAIMLTRVDSADELGAFLSGRHHDAVLLGPGNGVCAETRQKCTVALRSGAACVLDADALTSFEGENEALQGTIGLAPERDVVLTPHWGEFKILFPGIADRGVNKIECAVWAARESGAVVILKGNDTVIAAPGGEVMLHAGSPPILATAGSGDVLAGIVCGLLAQGMDGFTAACAAVWLHGGAAARFGIGLIAEDLPDQLPYVLRELNDPRG